MSAKSILNTARRIAVFRALQLGDMLCAVPALRALRAAAPRAHITLIGLPWAHEFGQRFRQYIDDVVAFPGEPELPEQTGATEEIRARFYREMQARSFDLALQLHGDGRATNAIVHRLGARRQAGFLAPGQAPIGDGIFIPYAEDQSETQRLLRLIEALGAPACDAALEFPISGPEWRELARLRAAYGLRPGDYVCLHPGSRAATRRWPADAFAVVADALAARGWRVVITGSDDERPITQAVVRGMHAGAVDLAGLTSLGVLAALLTGARLLVANDTGVAHVAHAVCVPSVVIYTASSPARWAPADRQRHRPIYHPVDCRPCTHAQCPIGHPCATGVTPDIVIASALAMIGASEGRRAAM